MLNLIRRFVNEDEGATMVEYGLMIGLVAVVLILTVAGLGQSLKTTFGRVKGGVDYANTSNTAVVTPGFP